MNVGNEQLPGFAETDSGSTVVMSYGMGVDSTAILLRWLADPSSRDFDLQDLVVITAHTGDEFDQTLRDVEEVVLPALRRHGVRFIQVGRTQRKTTASGEGVAVLHDSTAPQRLHVDGYKLSDEMLSAGTLPQVGGARMCSVHAKGNCLDPIIAAVTAGRRYRHVLGLRGRRTGPGGKRCVEHRTPDGVVPPPRLGLGSHPVLGLHRRDDRASVVEVGLLILRLRDDDRIRPPGPRRAVPPRAAGRCASAVPRGTSRPSRIMPKVGGGYSSRRTSDAPPTRWTPTVERCRTT